MLFKNKVRFNSLLNIADLTKILVYIKKGEDDE
jgi:hypothetical protein